MTKEITGHTKLICLLGSPVSHSISPSMHNASFDALDLDYTYLAFDVNTDTLESTINTLKNIGARGWNLTMPCKNLMADLCDTLSPAAKISGSVNTVVNDNGSLNGHTTDGIGFLRSSKEAGHDLTGKKIVLLGAGGASTSILVQAALDGVSEIVLFSRPGRFYDRAVGIMDTLNEQTNCSCHIHNLAELALLKEELKDSYILINGTSVGMAPETDNCIIPDASFFHKNLVVADVIYNPKETKLLTMAREAGCDTFNGMYMLLYQGAEAFRLWTGKEMPTALIKERYFK